MGMCSGTLPCLSMQLMSAPAYLAESVHRNARGLDVSQVPFCIILEVIGGTEPGDRPGQESLPCPAQPTTRPLGQVLLTTEPSSGRAGGSPL